MSGVIVNGVQWEHCSNCAKFVEIDNLGYEPPSAEYPYGRDLCIACTNASPNIESISPATAWTPQYEACQP